MVSQAPAHVIRTVRLLREDAQHRLNLAQELEETYRPKWPVGTNALGKTLSLDAIREIVKRASIRVKHLAAEFDTAPSTVEHLITDPASGLFIGKRGWVQLKTE